MSDRAKLERLRRAAALAAATAVATAALTAGAAAAQANTDKSALGVALDRVAAGDKYTPAGDFEN